MLKFNTFLEAKKTISYIDHNDEKQIVDLSNHQIVDNQIVKEEKYVTRNSNTDVHSFNDVPSAVTFDKLNNPKNIYWHKNGFLFRKGDLPSSISLEKKQFKWFNKALLHRTRGPADISINFRAFFIEGWVQDEETFVSTYHIDILERLKENPKDIRFYKIPNFEFQKIALDLDNSVVKYIKKLHPGLKDTKHAHWLTSQDVGLLD